MVDFQERDTKRTLGSDGTKDEESDDAESEDGTKPGNGGVESGDDGTESEHAADEAADGEDTEDHTLDEHHHHDVDLETVSVAVLTISSSRTLSEDPAGDAIVEALEAADHEIATRNLVNDDYDGVQSEVDTLVRRDDVDAVVATGGTGVDPMDVTVEAVRPLFEKELPGFGEVFRSLSFEEIGSRTIATRAVAGIADGVPVFCLPGSEPAARLGTADLIAPEVGHLAGLASRDIDGRTPEQTGGTGK